MSTCLILEQRNFWLDRPTILQKIAHFKKEKEKEKEKIMLTINPVIIVFCDMLLRFGFMKKASVHVVFTICIYAL